MDCGFSGFGFSGIPRSAHLDVSLRETVRSARLKTRPRRGRKERDAWRYITYMLGPDRGAAEAAPGRGVSLRARPLARAHAPRPRTTCGCRSMLPTATSLPIPPAGICPHGRTMPWGIGRPRTPMSGPRPRCSARWSSPFPMSCKRRSATAWPMSSCPASAMPKACRTC